MSNALLRRNSSKQGLQNLMRLTAQRSIEDAEEVERERRQRAREALRQSDSGSMPRESSPDSETPAEENMYESELKPSSSLFLEEDEGFSDWTQRRDGPRQQCLQVLGQGAKEGKDVEEDTINKPIPVKTAQASIWSTDRLQRHEEDTDGAEMERSKEREEEAIRAERSRRKEEEVMTRRREEIQRPKAEAEKRKEVKVSYTSRIFLKQEPKHSSSNEDTTSKEVTTHIKTKGSTSKAVEPEEVEAIWETEQRLEKIRRSLQVKENQELEQLRQRQAEAEQEFEELKRRREERRRLREEEEQRREEEEEQRLAKEEEEKRRMKEGIEKRRMEAAERMKSLSTSSAEGDELFSPRAPTHKISERTESLNRSLKKSNSFKKTQHLVLLSKIDDKLEQYTHAVENSQEARMAKASLSDLPSSPEVIASKKNLFEAGEAWSQSPTKGATCKDTEGLKVGVAGLITQWVKGPCDGSSASPCRPADVKAGDVMQKKNMWEIIGDSSGRPGQRATKNTAAGKKYKFVITGHGKYEKVAVDDENGVYRYDC